MQSSATCRVKRVALKTADNFGVSSMRGNIYHLLSRAFCQGVAIAQIVDLDILDVVTIGNVDVAVESRRLFVGGRGRGLRGRYGRRRLQNYYETEQSEILRELTDWTGGTSTCWMPLRACKSAFILAAAAASDHSAMHPNLLRVRTNIPAAAAGSRGVPRLSLVVGLLLSLPSGLRLRRDSWCREEGDLERLSNRDALRGSGSVWSNRDRLRGASSDMSEKFLLDNESLSEPMR